MCFLMYFIEKNNNISWVSNFFFLVHFDFFPTVVGCILSVLWPSLYSGLRMCNTVRGIQQISLLPECVSWGFSSLDLASICKALKGLFMTACPAGTKIPMSPFLLSKQLPHWFLSHKCVMAVLWVPYSCPCLWIGIRLSNFNINNLIATFMRSVLHHYH